MFVVVVRTHFCLQISKGNGKMVPWSNFKQITDILQKQCFDILLILLPKTEIKVWKFSSWKITVEKSCFTKVSKLGFVEAVYMFVTATVPYLKPCTVEGVETMVSSPT